MAYIRGSLTERFLRKVDQRAPDECWPWQGTIVAHGYGQIRTAGAGSPRVMAHRVAYELWVGPIPEGLEIDHLCRNTGCVNPAHLEPVTHAENLRRRQFGARTSQRRTSQSRVLGDRCGRGHLLAGENLYLHPRGSRECRTCRRAAKAAWSARRNQP